MTISILCLLSTVQVSQFINVQLEKNCSITFTLTWLNVSPEKMFKVSETLTESTGVIFNQCIHYHCHLSCLF